MDSEISLFNQVLNKKFQILFNNNNNKKQNGYCVSNSDSMRRRLSSNGIASWVWLASWTTTCTLSKNLHLLALILAPWMKPLFALCTLHSFVTSSITICTKSHPNQFLTYLHLLLCCTFFLTVHWLWSMVDGLPYICLFPREVIIWCSYILMAEYYINLFINFVILHSILLFYKFKRKTTKYGFSLIFYD